MKRNHAFYFGCFYLVILLSSVSSSVDSTPIESRRDKETKEVAKENIAIREKYKDEITRSFVFSEGLIAEIEELVKKTAEVGDLFKGFRPFSFYYFEINSLKEQSALLEESYSKKTKYESFLQVSRGKLSKIREKQLEMWPKIKSAVDRCGSTNEKKEFAYAQTREEIKESLEYKEFISTVRMFVQTNSGLFGENNRDSLIDKCAEYIRTLRNKSPQERAAEYTRCFAWFLLTEKINIILQGIDPQKEGVLDGSDFDLNCSNIEDLLFEKAIELEKEEYAADSMLKEIGEIYLNLTSHMKGDTLAEKAEKLFGLGIEEHKKNIKEEYKNIAQKIKIIYENANTLNMVHPDSLYENMNSVIEYNDSMLDLAFKVIEDRNYNNNNSPQFMLSNTKKTAILDMKLCTLYQDDISSWFEVKPIYSSWNPLGVCFTVNASLKNFWYGINLAFADGNFTAWNRCMQIDLNEDNEVARKRKEVLLELNNVLRNINYMFKVLCEALAQNTDTKEYLELLETIKDVGALAKGICYIKKISMLNLASGQKRTAPYVHSLLRFRKEVKEGKCADYAALNPKCFKSINSIVPTVFFLDKEKARRVLKYLAILIRQSMEASKKTVFLVNRINLHEQNTFAQKIFKAIIKKSLNPKTSLRLTPKIKQSIQFLLDKIVKEMKEAPKINSKAEFYSLKNNVVIFESAVQLLALYIPSDADEAMQVFTEYKRKNTTKEVEEIVQTERTKEIRESKKAVIIECEKTIVHIGSEISQLLLKMSKGEIDAVSDFSVDSQEYDSMSESAFQIPQSTFQAPKLAFKTPELKPEEPLTHGSIKNYFMDVVQSMMRFFNTFYFLFP